MSTDQEKNQRNQGVDKPLIVNQEAEQAQVEAEISECLAVHDEPSANPEPERPPSPVKQKINKPIKNRTDLIEKIQQSAELLGNQDEVKKMRLHRRRRKSLENILKDQIEKGVFREAEAANNIPHEKEQRLDYAVDTLYNFDLMMCKAIEKGCEMFDVIPVEVNKLAETIDQDIRIKTEIKRGFRDWIEESPGMSAWVDEMSSPSTRILLCHLYPLMHCVKVKAKGRKPQEIPNRMRFEALKAKIRATVDPPRRTPVPPLKPIPEVKVV